MEAGGVAAGVEKGDAEDPLGAIVVGGFENGGAAGGPSEGGFENGLGVSVGFANPAVAILGAGSLAGKPNGDETFGVGIGCKTLGVEVMSLESTSSWSSEAGGLSSDDWDCGRNRLSGASSGLLSSLGFSLSCS